MCNSLCLMDFPSMGKNCCFIFVDPLREFVWKGTGLGRAIFSPSSFGKAPCIAFWPIWSYLRPFLDCSDAVLHSNSGPALSLNPTLRNKWSSFKVHIIFIHSQGMLNKGTPRAYNTLVKCSRQLMKRVIHASSEPKFGINLINYR